MSPLGYLFHTLAKSIQPIKILNKVLGLVERNSFTFIFWLFEDETLRIIIMSRKILTQTLTCNSAPSLAIFKNNNIDINSS